MQEGVEELVEWGYDERSALYGCSARVWRADAQEREGLQGRAGRNGPAGEEGAVDEEAAEARVRREEVGGQGYRDIVPHSGAVWVDAQPEYFEQRRGRLEQAYPGQDATRARAQVELLYVEEVLREHVDGVEVWAMRCRACARRRPRR